MNYYYYNGKYKSPTEKNIRKKITDLSNKTVLSDNSKLDAEELGHLITCVKTSTKTFIQLEDWFATKVTENDNFDKQKAEIALYIAQKNYELITADFEDLTKNTEAFINKPSVDLKIIDELRKSYNVSRKTNSLPHSNENSRILILNILRSSFYNLYENFAYLPKSKGLEAKELLSKIAKLHKDILLNKYDITKLLKVEKSQSQSEFLT